MFATAQHANLIRLRATLIALALTTAGCASTGTFALSGRQLAEAEQIAFDRESAQLEAEGIHGTFLPAQWRGGRCRWSDQPDIAVCVVQYRHYRTGPLFHATVRYERDERGGWRWLGPVSEKTP